MSAFFPVRLALVGGALAVLLFSGASAIASPFTITSGEIQGFDCSSISAADDPGLSCIGSDPNHIEWVDGLNPVSSLDLVFLTPVAGVGAVPVDVSELIHTNIFIPTTFDYSINILDNFTITDEDGNIIVLGPVAGSINITFTETSNTAPCIGPNPLGTTCDDVFTFAGAGFGVPIPFQDADGDDFQLIFGLRVLDAATTRLIGDDTVFTAEPLPGDADGLQSKLRVTAQILPVPVPEPEILLLMGLGLLGLGLMRRRG